MQSCLHAFDGLSSLQASLLNCRCDSVELTCFAKAVHIRGRLASRDPGTPTFRGPDIRIRTSAIDGPDLFPCDIAALATATPDLPYHVTHKGYQELEPQTLEPRMWTIPQTKVVTLRDQPARYAEDYLGALALHPFPYPNLQEVVVIGRYTSEDVSTVREGVNRLKAARPSVLVSFVAS